MGVVTPSNIRIEVPKKPLGYVTPVFLFIHYYLISKLATAFLALRVRVCEGKVRVCRVIVVSDFNIVSYFHLLRRPEVF